MAQSLTCLQTSFSKGKATKEVTDAVRDMKDYLAFHQNVSIAMGTLIQHFADSLFVNMANLILLRRDSYLEHVKPGVKPDTWNQLRNAPRFRYGLFPDDMIRIAEQNITKFEASSAVPRPGCYAAHWVARPNKFQPYERRDSRVFLNKNRLNHGDSLPEDEAETEEGVVVLTLISLDPEVLKIKNYNYFANPTLVVKQSNQLGVKQTVNLVKENLLKSKQTVQLVKLQRFSLRHQTLFNRKDLRVHTIKTTFQGK